MTIALIIIGLLIALVGLAGCIVPLIPGPPLSFLALIIISYAKNWEPFSATFLIIMAVFTLAVTISDYVVPVRGAKKYGASKLGVWGSIIGMLVGLLFFPPWGMLLGAIVGALSGELLAGKKSKKVLRAGWGVFIGNMVAMGLKLALSGVMLFFYVKEMF
ncbi:MAG: DUF456 domain-containing protein [Desulfobacteraceae bacterium]|nr:MAG: DUF456 domain-containing protein [Desulfobacteraceae bacterium]